MKAMLHSGDQLPSGELRQDVVPYRWGESPGPVAVRADPGQGRDLCSSRDRTSDTDQVHVHLHRDAFDGGLVRYDAKEVGVHDRHAKLLLELSGERVPRLLVPLRLSAREKEDIGRLLLADEQDLLGIDDGGRNDLERRHDAPIVSDRHRVEQTPLVTPRRPPIAPFVTNTPSRREQPSSASGNLTRENIVDDITLYWLTGTGASAARWYWEFGRAAAGAAGHRRRSRFRSPTRTSPARSSLPRVSWVEKVYPTLTYFNEVDRGGHFAAWEVPELFSDEVRAAFESLR
jgi:hypothetical protein